jgi:hypothetical protein
MCGYGMAVRFLTDFVLHSSKHYHQVHATYLRRLSKKDAAVCGAVICSVHGDSNLHM